MPSIPLHLETLRSVSNLGVLIFEPKESFGEELKVGSEFLGAHSRVGNGVGG